MQILLASAKIMNESLPPLASGLPPVTRPHFQDEANAIALSANQFSTSDFAAALGCSNKIALQNKLRYDDFFNAEHLLPAILAYHGQAYKFLKAETFTCDDLAYAQQHLWILSFLYGILRPMDAIHPYRMEGGVQLPGMEEKNLFAYWKPRLTDLLIGSVQADGGVLIHLATEEFQHLFDWRKVKESVRVVQPQFLVRKGEDYRLMAIHAKSFRGAMTRFIIQNRLDTEEALHAFSPDGILPDGRIVWDYGDTSLSFPKHCH